ncbi:MAG: hypothetical protein KatS3mg032_2464 [Cyclobacteriaceae bacterium]|nr:MAG: hypothetical protein KatS3mg032_2464 [Cyclobacteriaceae bacterium]
MWPNPSSNFKPAWRAFLLIKNQGQLPGLLLCNSCKKIVFATLLHLYIFAMKYSQSCGRGFFCFLFFCNLHRELLIRCGMNLLPYCLSRVIMLDIRNIFYIRSLRSASGRSRTRKYFLPGITCLISPLINRPSSFRVIRLRRVSFAEVPGLNRWRR